MTVGDFPALGYNGNWQTFCPHGTLPGTYCALCGVGAYWLSAGPAVVSQGWQCPVCSHVMAPVMTVCPYCPSTPPLVTMTTTTNTVNISTSPDTGEESALQADAPADRLRVRLPDVMLHEGHQQIRALSAGWIEAFPGLQAKLADIESTQVDPPILLFRLTPDDGQQHG